MSRPLRLTIAAVLVLVACSKSEPTSPPARSEPVQLAAPQALAVYCGRGEPLIAKALAAFEAEAGIDLQIKYGDTPQLAAALLEEGARSPADVFIAQDASTLGFLDAKGLFAPLEPELLARVPEGFKSTRGSWIGLSGRARVLAFHTKNVATTELPKSIDELTEPRWKGRVGWAPENASFQSFVAAMIELRGRDETKRWLTRMKANEPKDYPKNVPAVQAVARGEVDVALVNHYYALRLKDEQGPDFPVDNHYFRSRDAASLVNLSGGAVLASSGQRSSAATLLKYLLSTAGQAHFVSGNHEFPVAIDAASPSGLPAIASLDPPAIDPAELNDLERAVALLRETHVLR